MSRWRRRTTPPDAPEAPNAPAEAEPQAAVLRPTHLGERFDAAVAAAIARQRPAGERPAYDLVREHLDVAHYLLQSPRNLDNPALEPVRNLLRQGAAAKSTPEINFSTSAYLERHPERAEERSPYLAWLQEGRAAGEIGDPAVGLEDVAEVLGQTPAELAEHLGAARTDLQERLRHGRLGEMFAKAAEVDPLVAEAWVETTRPKMTPLPIPAVAHQMAALHACHVAADKRRARVVVVAGRLTHRYVDELLPVLVDRAGAEEVLVLVTDEAVAQGAQPPAGVRLVDLATLGRKLKPGQADRVLIEVLRSLCAEAVVGVGSHLLYAALTPYGKAMRASERVFLTLDELEPAVLGPTGDALRFYYRHLDVVAGFIATAPGVAELLAETYQTPDAVRAAVYAAHGREALDALADVLLGSEETA